MLRCISILLLCTQFSFAQNIFDKYKSLQNKDGSFGDKNKEVATSMVLLSFLNEGILPYSEQYGETVKNSIKFLMRQVDELKKKPKDPKFIYSLWAISCAYSQTGISTIEDKCNEMYKSFFSVVKTKETWDFSGYLGQEKIVPMIYMVLNMYNTDLVDRDQSEFMKVYAAQLTNEYRFGEETGFLVEVIKLLWKIDHLPKFKKQNLDSTLVSKLIAGLNSNSPSKRKQAFNKCLYLKVGEIYWLIDKLKKSTVVELVQVAKDLQTKISTSYYDYKSIVDEELGAGHMLLIGSSYSCLDGHDGFKYFKTQISRKILIDETTLTLAFKANLKPALSNLSKSENELVNSAYLSMVLTDSDRQSCRSRFAKIRRERLKDIKPLPEEEGLDLLE